MDADSSLNSRRLNGSLKLAFYPFGSVQEKRLISESVRICHPDADDHDKGQGRKGHPVQPVAKGLRFLNNVHDTYGFKAVVKLQNTRSS